MTSDLFYVINWWLFLFVIGIVFFPFVNSIFKNFFDRGYIFSKTLGIAILSYAVFILGIARILPFSQTTTFLVFAVFILGAILHVKKFPLKIGRKELLIIIFQEVLFFSALLFWSYIKSFQPDIHGLEKFMDYGFINSILRTDYFPPIDMWFPPYTINYYYFGHLVTALLIKFSGVPSSIAYNLMLSTIFAFTVTSAFSIVSTLTNHVIKTGRASLLSGILAGVVTALGGNLHTVYAFFAPYSPPENPLPFWKLQFMPEGFMGFPNNYWYPNATRFVPFTIHEFPSYSFVVSDLHGHVLDIPFVFLTLSIVLSIFLAKKITKKIIILFSFLLAIMYMTNAWDGVIYFGLFAMTAILVKSSTLRVKRPGKKLKWFNVFARIKNKRKYLLEISNIIIFTGLGYIIFTLPFNLSFKPFVSGIGILCAPELFTGIGSIGPFLFESDHCQRTPLWMLAILYGFFYFFATALVLKIFHLAKTPVAIIFVLLLILLSTLLIAAPEFIYAKDIYPAHYRANTMFKLGYQAFIMMSLVASFAITYLLHKGRRFLWLPISLFFLTLILMYPFFAVNSYFGELKNPKGLDGLSYLKTLYPDDLLAIQWIQKNVSGQPVIAEAQGDSYTDYGRISANTGLPTILGWTVHEWLWRGDYSFPQSRLEDTRLIYEGTQQQMKSIIDKYEIEYIYVGSLERTKHARLNEQAMQELGTVVYSNQTVTIYKVD